jgi:hypothetical protein
MSPCEGEGSRCKSSREHVSDGAHGVAAAFLAVTEAARVQVPLGSPFLFRAHGKADDPAVYKTALPGASPGRALNFTLRSTMRCRGIIRRRLRVQVPPERNGLQALQRCSRPLTGRARGGTVATHQFQILNGSRTGREHRDCLENRSCRQRHGGHPLRLPHFFHADLAEQLDAPVL